MIIPFSAACERNKDPLAEVLDQYLQSKQSVLEIGSGTGQHAVHFSNYFNGVHWQCSDRSENIAGIVAQLGNAHTDKDRTKLPDPISLDVDQSTWMPTPASFDMVFTANTLHIMPWQSVVNLFQGLAQVTHENSFLVIYGPFKYAGEFTSQSNAHFDSYLRADTNAEIGSAIRDFEAIELLANQSHFKLVNDHLMPANNQCLVFQRQVKT